jgi:hypothetical protein
MAAARAGRRARANRCPRSQTSARLPSLLASVDASLAVALDALQPEQPGHGAARVGG